MSDANEVVLLVEDEPDDVELVRRAFVKAGVEVPIRVATDGEEALAYLTGHGDYADRARHPLPVLVLLDLKLPRMSGLEVLERLRGGSTLRWPPIVMLTSSEEDSDIERAYALGANSYLVKPVGPDALASMVKTLNLYWLILNAGPTARCRSSEAPRR